MRAGTRLALLLLAVLAGCVRKPPPVAPAPAVEGPPLKTVALVPYVEAGVPELDAAVSRLKVRFPRVTFEVEPPKALPAEWVVVRSEPRADQFQRRQVDADRALATPFDTRRTVIAVIDRDLFTSEYNFVFANFEPTTSQAIVSVARFRTRDAPPGEPKDTLALASASSGELLFFQLVSSTAKVLGMSYACPLENCVLHFPWGTVDLVKKGTDFCPKHQAEYDALMRRVPAASSSGGD